MKNFSKSINEILLHGKEEAVRMQNDFVGPEHLFLAMLKEGDVRIATLLELFHVDKKMLREKTKEYLRSQQSLNTVNNSDEINLNKKATSILRQCSMEADLLEEEYAEPEHLLLALLKDEDNMVAQLLHQFNINYTELVQLIEDEKNLSNQAFGTFEEEEEMEGHALDEPMDGLDMDDDDEEELDDEEDDDEERVFRFSRRDRNQAGSQTRTQESRKPASKTPTLDSFSRDYTKAAEEKKLDPVIGRDKEIERLSQILSRRKKNNPVLIGEPGVGKSAIVEGLALRIVEKKVSPLLFDKRVLGLDLASVVAGTKFRGQFEQRIQTILNELRQDSNVILFIDEIHTIVGAGSTPGTLDAANILKPALARGELQCIGATTLDEYRNSIEKDGALERRFQKVMVKEPTAEETLQMLQQIKGMYEDHHNVTYTDGAIAACVKLADRYITDRFFPDKAIDVMDEAGSRMHVIHAEVPEVVKTQEEQIAMVQEEKNKAVKSQNYELAASFRDEEAEMQERLKMLKQAWMNTMKMQREPVDETMIAEVVSMMTGVPVQRMNTSEGIRLKGMGDELKRKVIAQETAIDKLVKSVQRSRVGLKDPNRPIGTFMFLGPTGVGKTLLAKELATFMFGSPEALIRVDMSEYMDKYTVSRLIGAPPGYVGYEEGGQLTEKVRRHPYSIVLLDEIEKAHPDIYNILLQVMDEGRLTDTYGRTVDFRNTVIIMTSNVGSRQVKEFGGGIGFTRAEASKGSELSRSIIQKALNKSFSPEFINRIDEIITFDLLSEEAIHTIVNLEVEKLVKRVEQMGFRLSLGEGVTDFIATKGFDLQFGARPLRRAVQTYLEDEIAELLVNEEKQSGVIKVALKADGSKLEFRLRKR
jgi:ATP-dependent Clp protease ATP-binding subunit ClpC